MCNLLVKGKGLGWAYNSGMDIELRNQERESWDEVTRRLDFFLEAFRGLDVTAARQAASNLGKAVRRHEPLYVDRMTEEFGLEEIVDEEES